MFDSVDITTAISLIGALGIGSIATQFLSRGPDRRAARARALEALGDVEQARWAPHDPGEPTFVQASRTLQTAALLAQIPRGPVIEYLIQAQAAQWMSVESFRQLPDPEYGGGINANVANVVRDSAQSLSQIIWASSPRRHLTGRRVLGQMRRRAGGEADGTWQSKLADSREHRA